MHRLSIWLTALSSLLLLSYTAVAPSSAEVSRAEPASAPSAVAAPAKVIAPPGFTDTLVNSVPTPTGMDWTPDGRMLVTQDSGQIRVVTKGGQLLARPASTSRHGSARSPSAD